LLSFQLEAPILAEGGRKTIQSGLSDMRRPFGAYLFVGPTGVGKTHLAQFLAEELFGCRDRIVRLNMADYPLERYAQLLFGDPDDHRPAQIRGLLTRRISGQPFAVLLLDEFEKMHPKVHDRFLQLIDEGAFI
jgi:ATP-dependent Clp protease ATP-binding subunit ClpA